MSSTSYLVTVTYVGIFFKLYIFNLFQRINSCLFGVSSFPDFIMDVDIAAQDKW